MTSRVDRSVLIKMLSSNDPHVHTLQAMATACGVTRQYIHQVIRKDRALLMLYALHPRWGGRRASPQVVLAAGLVAKGKCVMEACQETGAAVGALRSYLRRRRSRPRNIWP